MPQAPRGSVFLDGAVRILTVYPANQLHSLGERMRRGHTSQCWARKWSCGCVEQMNGVASPRVWASHLTPGQPTPVEPIWANPNTLH